MRMRKQTELAVLWAVAGSKRNLARESIPCNVANDSGHLSRSYYKPLADREASFTAGSRAEEPICAALVKMGLHEDNTDVVVNVLKAGSDVISTITTNPTSQVCNSVKCRDIDQLELLRQIPMVIQCRSTWGCTPAAPSNSSLGVAYSYATLNSTPCDDGQEAEEASKKAIKNLKLIMVVVADGRNQLMA
ncbi:hypothetical protein PGTUg99_008616 [Puccinia graminis f. sp. tritici]|uniref:Uncharacterized protein n=1 Tax=Puccinia graminis f. sp. tritici TaxID=56615 RepID=A0A5B0LZ24_PUCGR|nr:hypothetical protein PGTUg99_008616 [Puccinia graminis f. sp. tritici]